MKQRAQQIAEILTSRSYELKGTFTLGWLDGRDPRDVLRLDSLE